MFCGGGGAWGSRKREQGALSLGQHLTQMTHSIFTLFGAPEKVGVRAPVLIWSPFYRGPPRTQDLRSNSALLRARRRQG